MEMAKGQMMCNILLHREWRMQETKYRVNRRKWLLRKDGKEEGNRTVSGADPGFPVGGGANPPGGGANIWFCQISRKTAWNWENFGP